jgi:hypothetical protein
MFSQLGNSAMFDSTKGWQMDCSLFGARWPEQALAQGPCMEFRSMHKSSWQTDYHGSYSVRIPVNAKSASIPSTGYRHSVAAAPYS